MYNRGKTKAGSVFYQKLRAKFKHTMLSARHKHLSDCIYSGLFCHLEQVLEGVIVLVQPRVSDGDNEVKEGFESGLHNNQ